MKYDITVSDIDSGNAIVYGGGNLKTLAYLANQGIAELNDRPEGSEASVKVLQDGVSVLSFTGDSDSVATLLKGKIAKLRKAENATDTADVEASPTGE